ncbi:hypothetical protein SLEP1_g34029 [Rubroshorea leprosula]|uniref:Uncharacterized protein n=1 Tax=Rubroshorea leprosula TaxID=152421 RepID=A0AAV5KIJ3_9ROSI|nr:hypothetical protein SLEP1_g34029 [Rubroshorea leprosula]
MNEAEKSLTVQLAKVSPRQNHIKCDVVELLIFKAALGSCPSRLAPWTWQL